jgi:uncharacterized membrane protein YfcA
VAATLTLWTAAGAFATAVFAGILRGFTGFGFALAAVPALTLVATPVEVVPCVMVLQVVAGAQLLGRTWQHVDWGAVRPLLVAALVATPLGTIALDGIPADPMRAAIGLIVLGAVPVLAAGTRLEREPALATRLGIGVLSGLLNGSTAMAGPPVILYFLATQRSAASRRASMLTYFFVLSVAGAVSVAAAGLVTWRTLVLAAVMFPALTIGNALGDRLFARARGEVYRRVAMAVLLGLGLLSIARAVAG